MGAMTGITKNDNLNKREIKASEKSQRNSQEAKSTEIANQPEDNINSFLGVSS